MVSLVLVAHSPRLLDALVEVVEETCPGAPRCLTAGGTDDGRMGTSLALVSAALAEALEGSSEGCVVLYDTGSAWLTIGFAMDALASDDRARVALTDAPLVEGTLAAAARAADGAPLAEVVAAAEAALAGDKRPPVADGVGATGIRRTA